MKASGFLKVAEEYFNAGGKATSIDDVQSWVIYSLDMLYITLMVSCVFNIYHLCKSKRLSRNKMLGAFYFFAITTLLCKQEYD